MPTIVETVVHNLAANGIQRIWGVPGDSLNTVTEAIRREKGIQWMLTRHEEEAAAPLKSCEKVTILAGADVEGAREEVLARADAMGSPIVYALRGKKFIEHDNPFDVGMTGLLGFASGYRAMEDCDALLMLGTDFPYQQFYPQHAKILPVDLRGEQLGRRAPLTQGMVGGVRETASALLPLLERKSNRTHLEKSLDHYRRTRAQLDDLVKQGPGTIHPQHFARLIDELADDDAILLPDVGTPVIWACRHLYIGARRRLIRTFWHGSMAAGTPLGSGAEAVGRNRPVTAGWR